MKLGLVTAMVGAALVATGCSKHDCDLDSEDKKQKFGTLADMTEGAHSCMVMPSPADGAMEMIATYGDTTVDSVAGRYKTWLEGQKWTVEMKPHQGTRANGKPYEGQVIKASSGDKTALTLIYPLGDTLIETVTSAK
jgi:hypothetical protein